MIACKVCGAETALHGVVDRGKSCEASRGKFLPLRGEPVWYHRCITCGFLFTADFDHWTREDWLREVYNDQYGLVDPDQADGSRAKSNAVLVRNQTHGDHRILDYGGGDGTMTRELHAIARAGACSWDPILDGSDDIPPTGSFDIVTAFEVFEHSPTPIETVAQALSFLIPRGTLMFSTLLCDALSPQAMDWPYIAPANGHVSIHTSASLAHLFNSLGWKVYHLSENLHVAERRLTNR